MFKSLVTCKSRISRNIITIVAIVLVMLSSITVMSFMAVASTQAAMDPYKNEYPWPIPQHDVGRTSFTNSTAPKTNHILWVLDTAQYGGRIVEIKSPITVADGKVYFSTGTCLTEAYNAVNMLTYCVDQNTGKLVWNYETNAQAYSGSTVAYGRVFVGTWNFTLNPSEKWPTPYLYCFDQYRGTLLWKIEVNGMEGAIIPADGKIYWTNTMINTMYCADPMTGQILWTASPGAITPAYDNGRIFCCGLTEYDCYNSSTGELLWKYDGELPGHQFVYGTTVAEGKVFNGYSPFTYVPGDTYRYGSFLVTGLGYMYCWDENTGNLLWRYETTWNTSAVNYPAVGYSKLFFGISDFRYPSGSGYLLALDINTGNELWKFDSGEGGTFYGSPVLADNKVYICTLAGDVYCLDQNNGTLLWQTKVAPVSHTPAIADGRLYVGDYDGKLYCFGKGPTSIEIQLSGRKLDKGESAWISGSLTDQSPASPDAPVANVNLQLSYLLPDGSATEIGSATTDERGFFSYEWTPPDETLYRIVACFNGDDSYESSVNMTELTVGSAPTESLVQTDYSQNFAGLSADLTTFAWVLISAVVIAIVIGIVNLYALRKRK